MHKRHWIILVTTLVLLTALLLPACAEPAPTTPTPTTPAPTTPTPTPTAPQVFTLKYSSTSAESSPLGAAESATVKKIEELTGGRVKIDAYWSGSLITGTEGLRPLQAGIADISHVTLGAQPGVLELNTWSMLPFLGFTSMQMAQPIFQDMYDKFPELQAEFGNLHVQGWASMPPNQLHTVKKLVHVPEDIAGMKLMMLGGETWLPLLEKVGATPLLVGPADWYTSLSTGLADGFLSHFAVIYSFKLMDVLPYHTIFGDAGNSMSPMVFAVNLDTWNKLPPDLQELIDESLNWGSGEVFKSNEQQIADGMNQAKELGHTIYYATPEEMETWQDACQPIYDVWIANQAARGPSQAIYDEAKRMIQEAISKK